MRSLVLLLMALPLASCGAEPPICATPAAPSANVAAPPGPTLGAADAVPPPQKDGRLPPFASPVRYAVSLNVDPNQPRFSGTAQILVDVPAPTSFVVLHARDMTVTRAAALIAGGAIAASATSRLAEGAKDPTELVLRFERPIPKGQATLEIVYDAPFSKDLNGIYRVKEGERSYAFTQFEATDARRAFPCFDEPSFKVPWEMKITVPKGMLAVANMPEVRHAEAGTSTVFEFAPTPPVPSYLLALAVGDLDVRAGATSPVPIRLITVKGKSNLGTMALDATAAMTQKLADYFGSPFPYPKLDIVAVPDFGAGAMENAGFITFREEALLLDPAHASTAVKRRVAIIIAHELAHQWFGDFVTMAWWNDLWLNEGFATWMETKVVDLWKPTFEARLFAAHDTLEAMDLDGLDAARAIRQPVTTTGQASEAFDSITYQKGAAVLAMLERWVGPEKFQQGIRDYLSAHAWKNAKAEDLLGALDKATGKDVTLLASTFLDQSGIPAVGVNASCSGGKLTGIDLEQEPWRPLGSKAPTEKVWRVPVCLRLDGQKDDLCSELTKPSQRVDVPGGASCPSWVHPNANASGYYRFNLPDAKLLALASSTKLTLADRLAVLSNAWAMVRAGKAGVETVLKVLLAFDKETNHEVVGAEIEILTAMNDAVIDDASRSGFKKYVAARLGNQKRLVGWGGKRAPSEIDDGKALLRKSVLFALGELAEDEATLKEADKQAKAWLADPNSVDGDIAQVAVELASRRAGRERFDALFAAMKNASTPQNRVIAVRGLSAFGDAGLLRETLDKLLSGEIKLQDVRYVFGAALDHPPSRAVVLDWVRTNWSKLSTRMPRPFVRRFVSLVGETCTKASRDEVAGFFQTEAKHLDGAERALAQGIEKATLCMELHERGAAAAAKALGK
ncbi:MAG TPA: M1 family aminopeptidase [Polyangiaceae bacterium]|nr:M1 family aminopeptidase [Polyangiaceae bacterium]